MCAYIFCNIEFTGKRAPFFITQPSTDNDVQIVSPNATMATLTCSLNVTIPSSMIITWDHNGSAVATIANGVFTGKSTTLVVENLEPSNAGDYECAFNDVLGSGWVLRRMIRLLITSKLDT